MEGTTLQGPPRGIQGPHTAVLSRRARGRRRAARYDAAARLRRWVDERGSGWCDWCLNGFPADVVEIDHVRSLSMGGTDTDGNVQAVCVDCRGLKTRMEFRTVPAL
ncbi:HNH endonuclease [Streptomyces rimosus]|uniref:HNH endonuclease n=1 Tax=Streptomyces rimosus TaxID=1927 RepID=UPI001F2FF300|nr:HNH endonuclease signature motif containing protein [Streptomyces rimosus]